jgi:hypothetical protein
MDAMRFCSSFQAAWLTAARAASTWAACAWTWSWRAGSFETSICPESSRTRAARIATLARESSSWERAMPPRLELRLVPRELLLGLERGRLRLRELRLDHPDLRHAAPLLEIGELGLGGLHLLVGLALRGGLLLGLELEERRLGGDGLPALDEQALEAAADGRGDVDVLAFDVALVGRGLLAEHAGTRHASASNAARGINSSTGATGVWYPRYETTPAGPGAWGKAGVAGYNSPP